MAFEIIDEPPALPPPITGGGNGEVPRDMVAVHGPPDQYLEAFFRLSSDPSSSEWKSNGVPEPVPPEGEREFRVILDKKQQN